MTLRRAVKTEALPAIVRQIQLQLGGPAVRTADQAGWDWIGDETTPTQDSSSDEKSRPKKRKAVVKELEEAAEEEVEELISEPDSEMEELASELASEESAREETPVATTPKLQPPLEHRLPLHPVWQAAPHRMDRADRGTRAKRPRIYCLQTKTDGSQCAWSQYCGASNVAKHIINVHSQDNPDLVATLRRHREAVKSKNKGKPLVEGGE